MLHFRTGIIEVHVIMVIIAIIDPLVASVAHIFHHPRASFHFFPVIYSGPQLFHIMIGIIDIVGTVVGLLESIGCVDRPVSAVLIVGAGGSGFPAETA